MFHRLPIVLALCACCAAARADTLVLANGDALSGEIVQWDFDSVVLDHPQLGRIRLSLDQLALDTGPSPSPGLFGGNLLRGWERGIDVGINGKRGNTENSNFTVGLDFDYVDDFKRWEVDGRYFLNRDEDGTSDNNGRLDVRRDWLLPESRWFTNTHFRYQYDEFESWEHRTTFVAGPGYHLVQRESHTLDVVVGGAFVREFGERDENQAAGFLGLDYWWTITENASLRLSNQLFPNVTPDAGELRNLSIGEWKLALTREPELSLKLGVQNEYETDVEPGDDKNDVNFWLALGLSF